MNYLCCRKTGFGEECTGIYGVLDICEARELFEEKYGVKPDRCDILVEGV